MFAEMEHKHIMYELFASILLTNNPYTMRRKIVCLLLACISLCFVKAEGIPITLLLTDGQTVSMSFDQKPKVVHKSSKIEITYGTNKLEIDGSQLNKIVLGDVDAVYSPNASKRGFNIEEGVVKIFGEDPECVVSVYDTDGSLLKSYKTDDDGNLEIPLSDFAQKILVIKTDSFSFKILAK